MEKIVEECGQMDAFHHNRDRQTLQRELRTQQMRQDSATFFYRVLWLTTSIGDFSAYRENRILADTLESFEKSLLNPFEPLFDVKSR